MALEIRSKSQLKYFLKGLTSRGKLRQGLADDVLMAVDLPETASGTRDAEGRSKMGGLRQNTRKSDYRKGVYR